MPRHPGNLLASRTNESGLSDHQIGKGITRSCASFVCAASEVVQMICLFPLLGSCASFVSAASEVVQVIGLSRCLRSCAGFIWVSIKLMHERNTISIEFPYDVLYDSNSGQKNRQWSTNK
ncbi:hypothetical protein MTR67_028567 [Solanum verrucosum]|uniref:Uncharacterized protein n=1 Tax=Solanum verrucosum TaxID=315347 RepID=A0AAF0TVY4_SOLVR|nr:hypothetical protein MTR67_028567 [Solanum verrucosum]